jgi:hypothetical protein
VKAKEEGLIRERIAGEFGAAVNMSADELGEWLATDRSKGVGWKGPDGALRESVGHASGRQIVSILGKEPRERTDDDYAHMRKVVGFIRRHLAQEPANPVTSRWRYSLMNWGHDPLKGFGQSNNRSRR